MRVPPAARPAADHEAVWFPDLGPTRINLAAAVVPAGLVLWLRLVRPAAWGWGLAGLRRVGVLVRCRSRSQRRPVRVVGVGHHLIAVNAAAFGFAFAGLRWQLGRIWPLAFLHGLD